MAAPRKYPDELRERAIRLVLDANAEPGSAGSNICRRINEQLGISSETLRGWVKQAVVAEITAALEASPHTFAWQRGVVMMVNNVLSTHGREPFTGDRRILVAIAGVGGVGA